MSTYLQFANFIETNNIKTIFEIGSRDLLDSIQLARFYDQSKVYAFECNPDGINECRKNISLIDDITKSRITLVEKAVHSENDKVKFYPFDVLKYDNIGASSMFKIDFSARPPHEEDIKWGEYEPGFVQKEIEVDGVRLDTFCEQNNLNSIDIICMDLQGYELEALKSSGEMLKKVRYIITETSFISTYLGGANFEELNSFLEKFGFVYLISDKTGRNLPSNQHFSSYTGGTSEFNCLFVNKNL
jgi:FkbM family methyltransferase